MGKNRRPKNRDIINPISFAGEHCRKHGFLLQLIAREYGKQNDLDTPRFTVRDLLNAADNFQGAYKLIEVLFVHARGLAANQLGQIVDNLVEDEKRRKLDFWSTLAMTAEALSSEEKPVYVLYINDEGEVETPAEAAQRIFHELIGANNILLNPDGFVAKMAEYGVQVSPPKPEESSDDSDSEDKSERKKRRRSRKKGKGGEQQAKADGEPKGEPKKAKVEREVVASTGDDESFNKALAGLGALRDTLPKGDDKSDQAAPIAEA